MCYIRVLSWNIRTFGTHEPRSVVLRNLAQLILSSQADVVCVQELQSGTGATGEIGASIAQSAWTAAFELWVTIHFADPGARWDFEVSGLNNSARAESMRDAYLFLWKREPGKSKFKHDKVVESISLYQAPVILRQPGADKFPGRRPGMIILGVTSAKGKKAVPFKVVSWHAPTPCNSLAKGGKTSSGRGLIELATLTEIGGFAPRLKSGKWVKQELNPLPLVDTIVLGDFNYSLDASGWATVYANLLENYEPCVSREGRVITTTYSANPQEPFKKKSSYDNIFLLRARKNFKPSLAFLKRSGVIDFIAEKAEELGKAAEIRYFATEAAWYVIYLDNYKKQYGTKGLSDHLPVWADFQVGGGSDASNRICPTSGSNNNCVFHAALGAEFGDTYIDLLAATHREEFADWLASRNAGNLGAAREELLRAMLAHFDGSPAITQVLATLLANDEDVFANEGFVDVLPSYIASIRNGRMLFWHEAALLAIQRNITINLFRDVPNGGIQPIALNPGHAAVDIYHFGLHFFRYRAN